MLGVVGKGSPSSPGKKKKKKNIATNRAFVKTRNGPGEFFFGRTSDLENFFHVL